MKSKKSKRFIAGLVLAIIGGLGFLGSFGIAEGKVAGFVGSVVLVFAGVLLLYLERKNPTSTSGKNVIKQDNEQYVYITRHGKKYHYDPNCGGMTNGIRIKISKARKGGLNACDKCCYDYLHRGDN